MNEPHKPCATAQVHPEEEQEEEQERQREEQHAHSQTEERNSQQTSLGSRRALWGWLALCFSVSVHRRDLPFSRIQFC